MTRALIDARFVPEVAELAALADHLPAGALERLRIAQKGEYTSMWPVSVFRRPGRPGAPDAGAALDRANVVLAVLDPGNAGTISGMANPYLAADLARATNAWSSARLERDERLRGSIVIDPKNPDLAADEIRRAGEDPRMVQVLMAYPPELLGDRSLHPVYAAAGELGLPVTLQASGAYTGVNKGLTAAGFPSSRLAHEAGWVHGAQPHLLSLLTEGTFARFDQLIIVFDGFGVAWLPSLLWRLEAELRHWEGRRPPGLPDDPGRLVAERVRFTTAGLELPADGERLATLLATLEHRPVLVFGSGSADPRPGADELGRQLPADWAAGVLAGHARTLFDSPDRAGAR